MNAIITGAARGIGKAVAHKLASMGYDLTICSKTENNIQKTAAELRNAFPERIIHAKAVDMEIIRNVQEFGNWCLEQEVPDIIVNNAGIYLPGKVSDKPNGDMEKIMNINFFSAYHLTNALLPAMIKKGSGHIFNMCSVASLQAYDGGGYYSISKFALMGFSKNLRKELMGKGIKVTSIYPGAVHTDTWGDYDNSNNRMMLASDIADTIASALSLSPQAVVEDIVIRPQLGDI